MKMLAVGDRVQIKEFHLERLVNRYGTITGKAGRHLKVLVPAYRNERLGSHEWFFHPRELERVE